MNLKQMTLKSKGKKLERGTGRWVNSIYFTEVEVLVIIGEYAMVRILDKKNQQPFTVKTENLSKNKGYKSKKNREGDEV